HHADIMQLIILVSVSQMQKRDANMMEWKGSMMPTDKNGVDYFFKTNYILRNIEEIFCHFYKTSLTFRFFKHVIYYVLICECVVPRATHGGHPQTMLHSKRSSDVGNKSHKAIHNNLNEYLSLYINNHMYIDDPEFIDRRSEKNKTKYGNMLVRNSIAAIGIDGSPFLIYNKKVNNIEYHIKAVIFYFRYLLLLFIYNIALDSEGKKTFTFSRASFPFCQNKRIPCSWKRDRYIVYIVDHLIVSIGQGSEMNIVILDSMHIR
ncbi:hypothetical protein ACJX0J_035344, partial [Zea mays]